MSVVKQRVIELTPSQTQFYEDDFSKAVAFVTGFGGGKTFSLVTKMVKMKLQYPKVDLLYLLPTYSMFRDILFPTLTEVLDGTGIEYKINKTTGEIFFDAGGRVILKSMDNPDAIVGMNVFAVFLDELDTLPRDKAWQVWIKALARARKKVNEFEEIEVESGETELIDGEMIPKLIKKLQIKLDDDGIEIEKENQMIVGSTPEGYRLLYKLFEKDRPDNYTLIQASGYENIHLPKDYYDNLKKIYPEELVDAYINGKFVNMAVGAVYKQYDRDVCDSEALYRDGEEVHISMDFNVMNMNAVVFVERGPVFTKNPLFMYEGCNSFHAVKHLKDIVDTHEMIQVIKNRYPRSPVYCYPDASGRNTSSKGFTTSDISLLKKAGFHVKAPNKNPRVMERVQSVNSALMTGLVRVNVRQCEQVAEALEQQVFNASTELPEKTTGSSIDDINDSFGYFIHMMFPISRKTMKAKTLKGF